MTVVVVDRGLRNGLLSHSLPSTIVLGLASASVTSMISNKVNSASSLTGSGGPVTLQPFSLAYPAHLTARQRRGIYEAQIRAFVEASDSVDLEDDVLAALWEQVPFPRLPPDAPPEIRDLVINVENPKRVYATYRASRRHDLQLLVEK